MNQLPPLEELQKVLRYDPWSGEFWWIKSKKCAGSINGHGYKVIRYQGVLHYAHRLAWYYNTGEIYYKNIDHINGNRSDNRIQNLRTCTQAQNVKNSRRKGCSFNKRENKWESYVYNDGKRYHIGYFNTELEAREAYIEKKNELAGEFSPYART